MSEQKIKGIIQKVARVNGKAEAQITVAIPAMAAGDVPLGEVFITIKPVQESMFPTGKAKGTLIRGGKVAKKKDEEDEEDED